MQTRDAARQFATLDTKEDLADYNFAHFRTKHLLRDFKRTFQSHGVQPGELAPGFQLPRAGGGTLRLSDLRGTPVLLHFGSITWPITNGSVEPLKKLHACYGDRVQFVDALARQAHPGTAEPPYRDFDQKFQTPSATGERRASPGRCWSTTWRARSTKSMAAWPTQPTCSMPTGGPRTTTCGPTRPA